MADSMRREHHWDALRAFLMLLGIPYHAAMVYDIRVAWDIQSPDGSPLLTALAGVLVTFRMPAFFIVAGYFAAMLLSRRPPRQWLAGRFVRLGLPFVTGLVLLAPLQVGLIDLADALRGLTSMTDLPTRATRDITHPGAHWIMHLWFLPALLIYSSLAAACFSRLRQWTIAFPVPASRPLGAVVTIAIVLWAMAIDAAHLALAEVPGALAYLLRHGIDPYLRYLPYFLLGLGLFLLPALRQRLVWSGGSALPLLAIASAIAASALRGRPDMLIAHAAADALAAVLVSLCLIGLVEKHCTRPDPRVDALVDASFTIYLLHHPLVFALGTGLLLLPWPPVAEFLVIVTASLALSFAAHRLIRRHPLALFFANGIMPSTAKAADPASASADRSKGTLR